jgi:hypothetical protein
LRLQRRASDGDLAVTDTDELVLATLVLCYGGASPDDTHLAADVAGIDDETLEVLAARESPAPSESGAKQVLSLTDSQLRYAMIDT